MTKKSKKIKNKVQGNIQAGGNVTIGDQKTTNIYHNTPTNKSQPKSSPKSPSTKAKKIFLSYAPKDKPYIDRLETNLARMKKDGILQLWSNSQLLAGQHIQNHIDQNLAEAEIVLIFLSADYLASDSCYAEMAMALHRCDEGTAYLIPVIVRACLWAEIEVKNVKTQLKDLLPTPLKGRPIKSHSDIDEAYMEIEGEIRKICNGEGR